MNESTAVLQIQTSPGDSAAVTQKRMTGTQPFCLVTGSSQGLGRALAEECARMGMNLILVALPGAGLPELSNAFARTYGITVLYREIDLTEAESPEALYRWIREEQLPVNMLVNNAGIGAHGSFFESSPEINRTMISLNIAALVHLTHLFLPELLKHPRSYILNVASLAAFYAMPFKPVYAPTKAFVLNFSLALRAELSETTVTVSTLCPGGIVTNEECRKLIAAQGFMGRISCHHPEEVASYALRQLLRNRAIIIPGLINKLARLLGTVVPLPLTQLFIRARFASKEQEKAVSGSGNRSPAPLLEVHHE
ncbi:MAG: SDR family NAD(P)-dependent oxidoreductase [Spirochaetaceae bacterium]|nr:MAG: SDR family NAD(P)-dependent oxidoreductase [Spirochaetaceae bacterium]